MRLTLWFGGAHVEYLNWDDPIPRKGERIIAHNHERDNAKVYLVVGVDHDFDVGLGISREEWGYEGVTVYLKELATTLADIVKDAKQEPQKRA
jgi:hypothetical protein